MECGNLLAFSLIYCAVLCGRATTSNLHEWSMHKTFLKASLSLKGRDVRRTERVYFCKPLLNPSDELEQVLLEKKKELIMIVTLKFFHNFVAPKILLV